MTTKVYTLTETTDRTGYPLGVFADRDMAIDVAYSHATLRIARCIAQDENTFGKPVAEGTYFSSLTSPDEHVKLVIVHQPSGEEDGVAWQIWPFDIVEPECAGEALQAELFATAET